MGGLVQFADFNGRLDKKGGVVFLRGGGGDTPLHSMHSSDVFNMSTLNQSF